MGCCALSPSELASDPVIRSEECGFGVDQKSTQICLDRNSVAVPGPPCSVFYLTIVELLPMAALFHSRTSNRQYKSNLSRCRHG